MHEQPSGPTTAECRVRGGSTNRSPRPSETTRPSLRMKSIEPLVQYRSFA